MFGEGELCVY